MKLLKVRLGHANNSSSSHSLVFLPFTPPTDEYHEFGWQYFTAADKRSKMNYLALCIEDSLRHHNLDNFVNKKIFESLFGFVEGYVDHQSVWSMPLVFDRSTLHWDFIEELKTWLMTEGIAILGGNDNEGDEHPLRDDAKFLPTPPEECYQTLIARKDGDIWIFYNADTGAQISFAFGKEAVMPAKLRAPMLVDMKITDFCPFDCPFCYMDSTTKGAQGDVYKIQKYLERLAAMEVFEVAIGGGEPTLHPHFESILAYGKDLHLTMNFTTKNTKWLEYQDVTDEYLSLATSVAFSVEDADQIYALNRLLEKRKVDKGRISLHIVPATLKEIVYKRMLVAAKQSGLQITLLGYKTVGRGEEFKPYIYDYFTPIQEAKIYTIAIDTVFAQQHEDKLIEASINRMFYHTTEGTYSMYIDAVRDVAAASSFTETTYPINEDCDIAKVWAKF